MILIMILGNINYLFLESCKIAQASKFRFVGPPLPQAVTAGAMVTLVDGRTALFIGGSRSDWDPVDTVLQLRDDLSGWGERLNLKLPWGMAYFQAITYFL